MVNDRRDLRRKLFHLAAAQRGYFTAAQAKAIGYSYQAQAYHVHAGNWLRPDRGLFRLAEWKREAHDDLARWALWSRGSGVVSHDTALAVFGLGELESSRVHMTVPVGFSRTDPALNLHYADLRDEDIAVQDGFRLTTAVRSLIDLAALGPDEDQLARAIRDAVERELVTIRALRGESESIDPRAALYIERALRSVERSE